MSEQKTDAAQSTLTQDKSINTSRRKLTTAALAGPVVLGTLASKQALGAAVAYQCTVSGQVSGNASPRPGEGVDCHTLGASPGCWKSPHVSNIGNGADGAHNWPGIYYPTMPFKEAFGIAPPCGDSAITMFDMLQTNGGFSCKDMFTRAAVASLLNAEMWPDSYPLTVGQVKDLYRIGRGLVPSKPFNQLFPGTSTETVWSQSEIMQYFESLYGNTDACPAALGL